MRIVIDTNVLVSASLGNNADGMGFFRPFLGAKPEIVETRLAFNYVEFGRIKIGVVHLLPGSQELYGIPVAEPVMEKELTILRAHHIGETNIVLTVNLYYRHGNAVHIYLCHNTK